MPSVLRLTLGEASDAGFVRDEITVLETNVDDVSGEVLGYTVDRLLAEGAKDVSIIPATTKKSRPSHIIKVIADQKDTAHLSEVLIAETGTLRRQGLLLRTPHHKPGTTYGRVAGFGQ